MPPIEQRASSRYLEISDTAERDEEWTSADAQPPAPDGGCGWVCVATCFTVNCFTGGVVSVGLAD